MKNNCFLSNISKCFYMILNKSGMVISDTLFISFPKYDWDM